MRAGGDLLDAAAILRALPQEPAGKLRNLEIFTELDSTSDRLAAVADLPSGCFDACLAEYQTAGRGRRGRRWLAPRAAGLCLSVNWTFREPPAALPALSLAAGIAVLRALSRLGCAGLALKWPNDIVHSGRKLGGVLIDLRGEATGPARVVVGVGVNVRLPRATLDEIAAEGNQATDLASLGVRCTRSEAAAALLAELALMLEEFGARGFAAFAEEWRASDALSGRRVRVLQDGQAIEGLAQGVDAGGALLLEADGRTQRILSGEVSVRSA